MKKYLLLVLALMLTSTIASADTWTVAGEAAIVNGALWAPENTANDMTQYDDNYYVLVIKNKTIDAGSYGFKVVRNQHWGEGNEFPSSNYMFNIEQNGTYTLVYSFNQNSKTIRPTASFAWVIAGDESMMGVAWSNNASSNTMTTVDDINYTLTLNNVHLAAGNYEYKATKNHRWDGAIGNGDGNATLNIPAEGDYNITFSLSLINWSLTATASLIPSYDTWTMVGTSAILHGDDYHKWDETNTDNDMTTTDGINYYLKIEGKNLNANTQYEYKAVKNHNWNAGSYPGVGQDVNYSFNLNEAGTYTLEYYLCLEGDTTLNVVATRTDELAPTYYMKHPWGTGADADWLWQQLTYNAASRLYYTHGQFGEKGVDINTSANDVGRTFYTLDEITVQGDPIMGDECVFYYHPIRKKVLIVKGTVTDIDEIKIQGTSTYKTIENGQIVIIRDGIRYNTLGVKM